MKRQRDDRYLPSQHTTDMLYSFIQNTQHKGKVDQQVANSQGKGKEGERKKEKKIGIMAKMCCHNTREINNSREKKQERFEEQQG